MPASKNVTSELETTELEEVIMEQVFRARAPLRLGLAGGGTDVSPYSEASGGMVLNATIDLYAHAIIEPRNDGKVSFAAEDLNESLVLDSCTQLPLDNALPLYCGIYNRIVAQYSRDTPLSFNLTTFADAPPGSGLGTSSTMVVCIIQVFSEWLNLGLGEYEVAQLAYQIERLDLSFAGGKQDQYAAAFGGFNFIEFGPGEERVLVNPLRVKNWIKNELEICTVLFYTGRSRDSAQIIQDQIEMTTSNLSQSNKAMDELKKNALEMKEAVLKGNLAQYADILNRSWLHKKKLSNLVSNPHLDSIYQYALSSGAVSGKVSGAGGGGFFMFFVLPHNRMRLIKALGDLEGKVINFHFTQSGAESWTRKVI